MPTNMMYADSMFPRLREGEDPAESIKRTNNYLYMLLEQLRYSFHNLELANFNAAALDRWEGIITDPIYVSLKGLDGRTAELTITAEKIATRLTDEVRGLESRITQTAGEIRTEVKNTKEGLESTISQTAGQIRSEVKSTKDGLESSITQTAEAIRSEVKSTKEGLQSSITQTANKISWLVKSGTSASDFQMTDRAISLMAGKIDLTGYVTFSKLNSVEYDENGKQITVVNGGNIVTGTMDAAKVNVINLNASKITSGTLDASKVTVENLDAGKITTGELDGKFLKAGTVTASTIKGNVVQLLTGNGHLAADMTLTASSSSLTGGSALNIRSGAVAIYSEVGDVFIRSRNQAQNDNFSHLNLTAVQGVGGVIYTRGHLIPSNDKTFDVGYPTCVYKTAYIANGVVSLSDRREKRDIDYDLTRYDALFDNLAPCSFRFVDGDRVHIGMISQDVEERMAQCGIDSMELAAFIKSPNEAGGYRYGLRYSEFISLLIDQVQKLKKRVKALEEAPEPLSRGDNTRADTGKPSQV